MDTTLAEIEWGGMSTLQTFGGPELKASHQKYLRKMMTRDLRTKYLQIPDPKTDTYFFAQAIIRFKEWLEQHLGKRELNQQPKYANLLKTVHILYRLSRTIPKLYTLNVTMTVVAVWYLLTLSAILAKLTNHSLSVRQARRQLNEWWFETHELIDQYQPKLRYTAFDVVRYARWLQLNNALTPFFTAEFLTQITLSSTHRLLLDPMIGVGEETDDHTCAQFKPFDYVVPKELPALYPNAIRHTIRVIVDGTEMLYDLYRYDSLKDILTRIAAHENIKPYQLQVVNDVDTQMYNVSLMRMQHVTIEQHNEKVWDFNPLVYVTIECKTLFMELNEYYRGLQRVIRKRARPIVHQPEAEQQKLVQTEIQSAQPHVRQYAWTWLFHNLLKLLEYYIDAFLHYTAAPLQADLPIQKQIKQHVTAYIQSFASIQEQADKAMRCAEKIADWMYESLGSTKDVLQTFRTIEEEITQWNADAYPNAFLDVFWHPLVSPLLSLPPSSLYIEQAQQLLPDIVQQYFQSSARKDHETRWINITFENAFTTLEQKNIEVRQYKFKNVMTVPTSPTTIYDIFDAINGNPLLPYARINASYVKAINNTRLPAVFNEEPEEEPSKDEEELFTAEETREREKEKIIMYVAHTEHPDLENASHFTKIELTLLNETVIQIDIELEKQELLALLHQHIVEFVILPFFHNRAEVTVKSTSRFAKGSTILHVADQVLNVPLMHDFAMNHPIVNSCMTYIERGQMYPMLRQVMMERFVLTLNQMFEEATFASMMYIQIHKETIEYKLFDILSKQPVWVLRLDSDLPSYQHATRLAIKLECALQFIRQQTEEFTYDFYCHFIADVPLLLSSFNTQQQLQVEESPEPNYDAIFQINLSRKAPAKNKAPLVARYQELLDVLGTTQDATKFISKGVLVRGDNNELRLNNKFEYNHWITFPYNRPTNPSEIKKTYVFACDPNATDKNKYMNLRHDERNGVLFPWVPVCIESAGKASMTQYRERTNVWQIVPGETISSAVLITDKVAKPKSLGKMPDRLDLLLRLSNISPTTLDAVKFFRAGIHGDANHKILYVLHFLNEFEVMNAQQLQAYKQQLLQIARQGILQSSGLTIAEATNILENNLFIDVRAWEPALRIIFGIEMVFCCQDRIYNKEGTLCSTYYDKFRIVNTNANVYDKTVLLYLHMGAEFEGLKHPTVEPIIRVEASVNVPASFTTETMHNFVYKYDTNSSLIESLQMIVAKLNPTRFVHVPSEEPGVQLQSYDGFNKTRVITYEGYSMITDPMNNVMASRQYTSQFEEQQQIRLSTIDIVLRQHVPKYPNALVLYVVYPYTNSVNKQVHGILLVVDSTHLYFPVLPVPYEAAIHTPVYSTAYKPYPVPMTNAPSFTVLYKLYERVAIVLTGNCLYLLSRWMQQRRVTDVSPAVTLEWFMNDEHVVLAPQTSYDIDAVNVMIHINGNMNRNFVWNDEKVIIRGMSEQDCWNIRQRLKFTVDQAIQHNFEFVRTYFARTTIHNFYNSAEMFHKSNMFTVYNSPDEYRQTYESPFTKYELHTTFADGDKSYFVLIKDGTDNLQKLAGPPVDSLVKAVEMALYYKVYETFFMPQTSAQTSVRNVKVKLVRSREDVVNVEVEETRSINVSLIPPSIITAEQFTQVIESGVYVGVTVVEDEQRFVALV